jgi:hypothetical protein
MVCECECWVAVILFPENDDAASREMHACGSEKHNRFERISIIRGPGIFWQEATLV